MKSEAWQARDLSRSPSEAWPERPAPKEQEQEYG